MIQPPEALRLFELGDEPPDVALGDVEPGGDAGDVEELVVEVDGVGHRFSWAGLVVHGGTGRERRQTETLRRKLCVAARARRSHVSVPVSDGARR